MSRRRRQQGEGDARHEAWAIPYGDLVTLMMAFFVVMYAVSVVDAGKYRVLSDSLIQAFGTPRSVAPIQIGEPVLGDRLIGDEVLRSLNPLAGRAPLIEGSGVLPLVGEMRSPSARALEQVLKAMPRSERDQILAEMGTMAGEVEGALAPLIADELIKVNREAWWIEIEIKTSLLFQSGSAILEPDSLPVLEEVAGVLARGKGRIHVEGHTDNLPIGNSIYPSNWELSSGRAATVVNLFAQNGVDPRRMVAIGYGEFQPLADNATAEGRARNRRVAVVILPGPPPRGSKGVEPERLRQDYEEAGAAAPEV
ncbi:MAG: flagellar motor protein MotD [Chromatiaceae bacterium]|nr:flagellar motor protein MotD [Chromatiaceae bacterium]